MTHIPHAGVYAISARGGQHYYYYAGVYARERRARRDATRMRCTDDARAAKRERSHAVRPPSPSHPSPSSLSWRTHDGWGGGWGGEMESKAPLKSARTAAAAAAKTG